MATSLITKSTAYNHSRIDHSVYLLNNRFNSSFNCHLGGKEQQPKSGENTNELDGKEDFNFDIDNEDANLDDDEEFQKFLNSDLIGDDRLILTRSFLTTPLG